MEYVYAAMLLHKAGQNVDEAGLNKVLEAAGVKTDPAQAKALIAALDGVDIDKAIEEASKVSVAAAPVAVSAESTGDNAAKKAEEDKKKEEETKKGEQQAAAGLSALFG